MKPLDQACIEPGRSDSLAACLASILEIGLGEIGSLDAGNHLEGVEGVLATHGYGFCWIAGDLDLFRVPDWAERHCVVVGASPRDARWGHAVVAEVQEGGLKVLHDPHPSRAGVAQPWRGVVVLFRTKEFSQRIDA